MSENKQERNYVTIRDAILADWDPIGVSEIPDASDEYDAYLPGIYAMLIGNKTTEQIFEHLWSLETDHMGLDGDRDATMKFARKLRKIADLLEGSKN